jgi:DNA-binding NtrC family response regulator
MPRLDIRLKTNLAAVALLGNGHEQGAKKIRCRELSLSSGLVDGLPHETTAAFSMNIALPARGRVELVAEPLHWSGRQAVVRFFFPERQALTTMWGYIRDQALETGRCPYCGAERLAAGDCCPCCGHCLSFGDQSYLDRHLAETFPERLKDRLGHLEPHVMQRVLTLLDSTVAGKVYAASDEEFVGTAPAILEVFAMIRRAATTDMNILILGESGTGKELTAQAIHEKSQRRDQPLIVVNCAAIPEGLLESELFGHERGTFTGAVATRKGRFEQADGGTIFLDEIGDLQAGLQAKLLRFLEDRTVERVGGKGGKRVDVRIIAATNCDLESMVTENRFRKDLFFRLNSFTVTLPPLRERGEDAVILAKYFFATIGRAEQTVLAGFSPAALRAIRAYTWPGNVRELINKVRRALVMATGEWIEPADMELAVPAAIPARQKGEISREQVCAALSANGHVLAHAARDLGVSRPTIYALLRKHQIRLPECQP